MQELTYILGAGASYESIPLVKNFPRRFMFFVDSMLKLSYHQYVSPVDRANTNKLYKYSLGFYREIVSHQSFDTFFKKLFHTDQYERINLFKKVLNIYFLWESITIEKGNANEGDEIKTLEEGDFIKKSRIDKRYDALIAGLLKPKKGRPEPYCRVNFISWNYDLNLILSLKNYYSPNSPIGEFIKEIKRENGIWEVDDLIKIVNMNGYFYRSELNNAGKIEDVKINEMIFGIIKEDYFENHVVDKDANRINFAWESENTNANFVRQLIVGSDNIVVIGYTFPLYNRLVDLTYLRDINLVTTKRLYIQDPNAVAILESSTTDFSLRNVPAYGNAIQECDSFFIPSNIFKP